jgi:hypothetical protein
MVSLTKLNLALRKALCFNSQNYILQQNYNTARNTNKNRLSILIFIIAVLRILIIKINIHETFQQCQCYNDDV